MGEKPGERGWDIGLNMSVEERGSQETSIIFS